MATLALKSQRAPVPLSEPGREHHVFVVCTGESCADAGAPELLNELEQRCQHHSADLRIGASNCLGHCQLAPAMVEDGRILGAVSPRRLKMELMRLGLILAALAA